MAELLRNSENDPAAVEKRVPQTACALRSADARAPDTRSVHGEARERDAHAHGRVRLSAGPSLAERGAGETAPVRVVFREVQPWNCWLWLQPRRALSEEELVLLDEVLKAWFILGRLGGFNARNLQVQEQADAVSLEVSGMAYSEERQAGPPCVFHAMGQLETKGGWARCWVDLGTADELALDALLNALTCFSKECVELCSAP